jgi:hypothetical protein
VEELKEGRGVQRLTANRGALPRLRGRGEQGYVVNDNLDRALLYRLRDGDREVWRCFHRKIRLWYKSSIGAKQSVENGIACIRGVALFTTASQARRRSTASPPTNLPS